MLIRFFALLLVFSLLFFPLVVAYAGLPPIPEDPGFPDYSAPVVVAAPADAIAPVDVSVAPADTAAGAGVAPVVENASSQPVVAPVDSAMGAGVASDASTATSGSSSPTDASSSAPTRTPPENIPLSAESSFPWSLLLVPFALILFILFLFWRHARNRRRHLPSRLRSFKKK